MTPDAHLSREPAGAQNGIGSLSMFPVWFWAGRWGCVPAPRFAAQRSRSGEPHQSAASPSPHGGGLGDVRFEAERMSHSALPFRIRAVPVSSPTARAFERATC